MRWSNKLIRLRSVWLLVPVFIILADPTYELIFVGAVLALLGAAVRAWAAGTIRKNRVLTITGPYAYTRNPLYLGSFLVGLGVVISSASVWLISIFLTFFTVVYWRTVRDEERKLEELFGEDFIRYSEAVPRFLPRLRPYRSGDSEPSRFQFQNYLGHREWELALGVFFAFMALWGMAEWDWI